MRRRPVSGTRLSTQLTVIQRTSPVVLIVCLLPFLAWLPSESDLLVHYCLFHKWQLRQTGGAAVASVCLYCIGSWTLWQLVVLLFVLPSLLVMLPWVQKQSVTAPPVQYLRYQYHALCAPARQSSWGSAYLSRWFPSPQLRTARLRTNPSIPPFLRPNSPFVPCSPTSCPTLDLSLGPHPCSLVFDLRSGPLYLICA